MRQHAIFCCIDDKHLIKVGEPECPICLRGRQVIVSSGSELLTSPSLYER